MIILKFENKEENKDFKINIFNKNIDNLKDNLGNLI